jgi:ATP-dependent Lon protease
VFLLDEVDKMSSDFRGDPSAALLEVLDPEQNNAFNDHYLDLDYDLSDVMFITTANSLSGIPLPLQDRMEIIQLTGYTEFEKLNIAVKYLVSRQRAEAGLTDLKVDITEAAIRTVINHYTHEAGVRSLEREIGGLCRKIARQVLTDGRDKEFVVGSKDVPRYLGPPKYHVGKKEERDEIGLTNGLAVTAFGGDLLAAEVAVVHGKGKLIVTGKLGDVMQESAQAAMSYVRSRARDFGIQEDFYAKVDVHIHFPEGAIPKDGPSAGVTMTTSLVSTLLKIPVRRDVAMTGEITLRGRVLPIGGLKEKLLAAHRAGMNVVFVPKENRRDIRDVPRRVLKGLRVLLVEHVDDVLRDALVWPNGVHVFGNRPRPMEYREGVLIEPEPTPTGIPSTVAPGVHGTH